MQPVTHRATVFFVAMFTNIYNAPYSSTIRFMMRVSSSTFLCTCLVVPYAIFYRSQKSKEDQPASTPWRVYISGSAVLLASLAFTRAFYTFAKRYVISMDLLNKQHALAPETQLQLTTLGFFGQNCRQTVRLDQISAIPPAQATTATFQVPHLNRLYYVQPPSESADDKEPDLLQKLFFYLHKGQ